MNYLNKIIFSFFLFIFVSFHLNFAQEIPASTEEIPSETPKGTSLEEGAEQVTEGEGISQTEEKAQEKEVVEIKEVGEKEGEKYYSMELRNVDLKDLLRVLAHDYKLNIIMDKDVAGEITASFEKVTLKDALDNILGVYGYTIVKKGDIMRVTKELVTKVFTLKSIEAKKLVEAVESTSEGSTETGEESTTKKVSTILDLLSEDGKILLGDQPNSIMVIDHPENIQYISEYLNMADKEMVTKVFKLKYIQASELLGISEGEETTEETTAETESSYTETEEP